MAIEVETKDCTALSDAELGEMADLSGDEPVPFDIGLLSKERDSWVLITTSRFSGRLHGFSFCTLERIGGTPSVLVGLASVKRNSRRDTVLKAMMTDQLRRAVLAFPDEDVLVGSRMADPSAMDAYKHLSDVVPRPGHRANGEERAWGRRLVKRFDLPGSYDDSRFRYSGIGGTTCVLDFVSAKPEAIDSGVTELFAEVDTTNGDCLITFGWAMAEDLAKLA